MTSPSRPRLVLSLASVTLVVGLAADIDDYGPFFDILALVAVVGALIVIAVLLPAVVAGAPQRSGEAAQNPESGDSEHL